MSNFDPTELRFLGWALTPPRRRSLEQLPRVVGQETCGASLHSGREVSPKCKNSIGFALISCKSPTGGSFGKLRVLYLGFLVIRILLFRVLY